MFTINLFRWITLAGIFIWLLVYWQAGRKVFVDIQAAVHSNNSLLDSILLIVISLFSFVIIGICLLGNLKQLQIAFSQNFILVFAGTLLTISSIIGMFACRYFLGKYWTAEINLTESHKIIDTGPYRIVRHPIYTFAILMYLGCGMVFLSLWTGSLVGLIAAAYFLKTKEEDAYLRLNLAGYRDYVLRVRYRLLPGFW
jgi:protein-S-isoprenylcysteine O-methyltransferase Ste14